jgi:hypothetical protein
MICEVLRTRPYGERYSRWNQYGFAPARWHVFSSATSPAIRARQTLAQQTIALIEPLLLAARAGPQILTCESTEKPASGVKSIWSREYGRFNKNRYLFDAAPGRERYFGPEGFRTAHSGLQRA